MELRRPLTPEDCQVQSMPEASPTKWHLAHTTWFFEQFVLGAHSPGYRLFHGDFSFLFNSYYNTVGPRHERPKRGVLTRPPLAEVERYREHVDRGIADLLGSAEATTLARVRPLLEIGLNHEQQHQELILTDIKHLLWSNPLRPAYSPPLGVGGMPVALHRHGPDAPHWRRISEGLYWIGHEGDSLAYDNESPRHRVFLNAFEIASRPVTCAEYLRFMDDGSYTDPRWWLDEGWATLQRESWRAPMYWEQEGANWRAFTLAGIRDIDPHEPVCHISFFEADAYARWTGARLPTEAEWEVACREQPVSGNFLESGRFHPAPTAVGCEMQQAFGGIWEWTQSPYTPYPGYQPPEGALGEYNGKFMCNQHVLRGGSCATPESHVRSTYRNFFPAATRWQFAGLRLARDAT
jgi:ergothioneine biosynthesis protein EgtB